MIFDPNSKMRWTITSLIRIVIPMLFAWVGLEVKEDMVAEIAVAMGLVFWVCWSLWMSVSGRGKLLEKPPLHSRPIATEQRRR